MAKICPCYSLCPLIEQKSFLGLTEDAEPDTVIVTANSNIISRYRVSDPKQITSWNSKGSVTSAVVYDRCSEHYVGVFNHNELRLWSISDESIDKVKKYKFAEKIRGILVSPVSGRTIIVFAKGNVVYLDYILDHRKETFPVSVLKADEAIQSFHVAPVNAVVVVTLLVTKGNEFQNIIGVSPDQSGNLLFKTKFQYAENKLLDHCLLVDSSLYCVALWSDGRLCKDSLFPNSSTANLTMLRDMDVHKSAAVITLSSDCVAVCTLKDDGMVLIIYNVKYNLIQCKQFYENCSNPPHLWNFQSKLFLIMGHNLVVVPYVQENRKLSTLVGSHIEDAEERKSNILSETEICKINIPMLMEQNNLSEVKKMITSFSDIPDSTVIDILQWSLTLDQGKHDILSVLLENYCIADSSKLRNIVNTDSSLELLEYVISSIPLSMYNTNLINWASMIIDAFYQQYVTSNDTVVLEKLVSYLNVLRGECECLQQYKEIASTASCIKRKKIILKKHCVE